MQKFYN